MRREFHPSAPRLADLVDDPVQFRADDVYRRPRLSRRAATRRDRRDPSTFATADGLWADLLGRSPRRPAFRLVDEGVTTAGSAVTRRARIGDRDLDDLAAPNRIVEGYRAGATVVLQGLHLTDPRLAELANNLALELDQPIQVNAYLTPATARGLDVHFDYHDVFVVQLEGTKRWRIWEPLARSRNPVSGKHRVRKPTFDELPAIADLDVTLTPGDVLYLPRGFPHAAETGADDSAHLTIGLLAITWHRVVRRAVDDAVAGGALTASIPLSTLAPGEASSAGVAGDPAAPLADLELDLSAPAVREWTAREIWSRQAATRLRPRRPVTVTRGTTLAVTPGPLIWLTRRGEHCVLGLGDRSLTLPVEAYDFLAALLDGPARLTPGDVAALGGLDDESRSVVVSRLVDEGVLAVVG